MQVVKSSGILWWKEVKDEWSLGHLQAHWKGQQKAIDSSNLWAYASQLFFISGTTKGKAEWNTSTDGQRLSKWTST